MLTFEVIGADRVVGRMDELQKRIDGFYLNMPEEFLAWQEEDMHRQEPWAAQRKRRYSERAKLILRRHSYKTVKYRAAHRAARRAAARAARRRAGLRRLSYSNPILRPELFEQLCNRMAELLRKTITWS